MDIEKNEGESSSKNLRDEEEEENNLKKIKLDLPILTYDILRVLFQYLNVIDLINANRVCRSVYDPTNYTTRLQS